MAVLFYMAFGYGLLITSFATQKEIEDGSSLVELLQDEDLMVVASERTPSRQDGVQLEEDAGSGDEYPSSKPELGDRSINFTTEFRITDMFLDDFNESVRKDFSDLARGSFEQVPGFIGSNIVHTRNGSVIVGVGVELDAGELNQEASERGWVGVTTGLLTACTRLLQNTQFTISNDTILWSEDVETVEDNILELCNTSTPGMCGWGSRLTCARGVLDCVHLCEAEQCRLRGTCSVSGGTDPQAICRCHEDEWYSYSGPQCEHSSLRWTGGLAITCGVIGVMGVAVAVTWWRYRRGKHKTNSRANNSFTGTYCGSSRGLGKKLFKPSFYSDDGWTPNYRMFRSESDWEGEGHTTQGYRPELTPTLQYVDTQTPLIVALKKHIASTSSKNRYRRKENGR